MIPDHLEEAVAELGVVESITRCSRLSGGSIHDVRRLDFDTREPLVVKISTGQKGARLLQSEANGLKALSDHPGMTIRVPNVIGFHMSDSISILLMEHLRSGSPTVSGWQALGKSLALFHDASAGDRYGFHENNYIGSTPQQNDWHDDWIEFNRTCRLGPQIQWARHSGYLTKDHLKQFDLLLDQLGNWIPGQPKPSLLHGDLWSGNILPLQNDQMAMIDPACSVGDGWADIAMMQLFGGIPDVCIEAYCEGREDDDMVPRDRLVIYQLYHVLNHVNLFGDSYLGQALGLMQSLLAR